MSEEMNAAEEPLKQNESTSKWTAKASVFTDLFSETEYAFQLYQALHPEDTSSTANDVIVMTLESHLVNQQYNDLGFMVGDKLIILVEHQSTWSENIVVRVLMYVIDTWNKYIKQNKLDVYGKDRIELPKPELYVVYTGPGAKNKPEILTLKDTLFDGADIAVDCKVKVITDGKKGDIINQFVRFCHVLDGQIKEHGRTRKAVEETIRICRDENVLKEYLERQWEEVLNMYDLLFNQETIMENHDESMRREGREEGRNAVAKLMNYLLSHGRTDDALRATTDKTFLEKLLSEFTGMTPAK